MPSSVPQLRQRPSEADGRQSLVDHATNKALEARAAYGSPEPGLPPNALDALLADRRFVRHPVRIDYDASRLEAGEFAFAEAIDDSDPAAGFVIHVHPQSAGRNELLPLIVGYHLVRVNYGEIADHEAAEAFGAALCGMQVDDYYRSLCQLADSLPQPT